MVCTILFFFTHSHGSNSCPGTLQWSAFHPAPTLDQHAWVWTPGVPISPSSFDIFPYQGGNSHCGISPHQASHSCPYKPLSAIACSSSPTSQAIVKSCILTALLWGYNQTMGGCAHSACDRTLMGWLHPWASLSGMTLLPVAPALHLAVIYWYIFLVSQVGSSQTTGSDEWGIESGRRSGCPHYPSMTQQPSYSQWCINPLRFGV